MLAANQILEYLKNSVISSISSRNRWTFLIFGIELDIQERRKFRVADVVLDRQVSPDIFKDV